MTPENLELEAWVDDYWDRHDKIFHAFMEIILKQVRDEYGTPE